MNLFFIYFRPNLQKNETLEQVFPNDRNNKIQGFLNNESEDLSTFIISDIKEEEKLELEWIFQGYIFMSTYKNDTWRLCFGSYNTQHILFHITNTNLVISKYCMNILNRYKKLRLWWGSRIIYNIFKRFNFNQVK